MKEEMEDIDTKEKGDVTLLLQLASILKELENVENSPEFLSLQTRQVLEEALSYAKRTASIRYFI